ncbi:MAG: RHS repeat-associated core domain-containing protein [Acaryochloridaceae cyanobacterium RL_2_7]|nr:RHS repeat-associated core domain-containing protein [Acaryochloridaceae cyanobacterium RL_2_7]
MHFRTGESQMRSKAIEVFLALGLAATVTACGTAGDNGGEGSDPEPEAPETERFIYDGDHIALVFDGEGNQTHRYFHGPQIDQVLAEETADGEVRWALVDNQGTVRDVIDNDGNVLNHISYDSFGQITEQTNATAFFRFGYTGREFDTESGQYFYRARYFDPQAGRFISEDPIGFNAGDTNLYRYVGNSPQNYTDPSGLFKIELRYREAVPFTGLYHADIVVSDKNGVRAYWAGPESGLEDFSPLGLFTDGSPIGYFNDQNYSVEDRKYSLKILNLSKKFMMIVLMIQIHN